MKSIIFVFIALFSLQVFAQDNFEARNAAVEFVIAESDGHFDMEEFYHPFIEESSILTKKEAKKYKKDFWVNMQKYVYVKIKLDDCVIQEAIVVVDKKTNQALRAFYIE